jgi:hypothetical protein
MVIYSMLGKWAGKLKIAFLSRLQQRLARVGCYLMHGSARWSLSRKRTTVAV